MAACCFLVGGGGCFSMRTRPSASFRRISAALKVAFPVRYAVASVPVTPNAVRSVGELSMTYRCAILTMLRTLIAFAPYNWIAAEGYRAARGWGIDLRKPGPCSLRR